MFRGLIIAGLVALAGCAPVPRDELTTRQAASRTTVPGLRLPPMKAFSDTTITRAARHNSLIAADFLDLSFQLESGRSLPVLSRFEGPITVSVSGRAPASLTRDLDRLIKRLRIEAAIDISRARGRGRINIDVITRRQMQATVPNAACFVAPNVSTWAEYRAGRRGPKSDWAKLTRRERMAIFIPGDVSPQEVRDCLHEELAQALGPVNDLYRLTNSVFNDDNFHNVLTGFDMLILRAYYAPELRSGMSRADVAARLPAILARINPAGGHGAPARLAPSPRDWVQAINTAIAPRGSDAQRLRAAQSALSLARAQGWRDTRLAYSLYTFGQVSLGIDNRAALAAFREAEAIYRAAPDTQLQAAHMGMQLAAYALSAGRAEEAIGIVERHLPHVIRGQNAALLSTFLMVKAQALAMSGQDAQAQLVRLDSLGWARYGFGTDEEVGARLGEIDAIAARGRRKRGS